MLAAQCIDVVPEFTNQYNMLSPIRRNWIHSPAGLPARDDSPDGAGAGAAGAGCGAGGGDGVWF